ncbi:MAG: hypothetical protein BGN88_04990 [Clostridiales bacterium 43-6]|nr:MAG: hypothetical protein BGN88_04990 [Clostridiales bacterium 43-6]
MDYDDCMLQLNDKVLLDKLYGFAYKRCNSAGEAEDLCSDILVSVLSTLRKNPEITHFHGLLWTIAHRVYADFCEKRKKHTLIQPDELTDCLHVSDNNVDTFLETEEDRRLVQSILREISFLAKIYRDVMVFYYLDRLPVSAIAKKLCISETAVKQRLFSARNTVKEEVLKMDKQYTLKPVDIAFIGTGNPVGNDPRSKAERVLSKNVVYLCKKEALSAKEISEKLGVPMPFIEDELDIQLKGENGTYGLLRKLENGKYIANAILLDLDELEAGTKVYKKHLVAFCQGIKQAVEENRNQILSFPFLSRQKDPAFLLWSLISGIVWELDGAVKEVLKSKYFKDTETIRRDFTLIGIAVKPEETLNIGFYGCDGIKSPIGGQNICGYSSVFVSNVYGAKLEKHFSCGHNISSDPLLLITIRSIGGLDINSLSQQEKEYAAKAVECGYLQVDRETLTPKIIVIEEASKNDFYRLLPDYSPFLKDLAETIAEDLYQLIKQYVPKHLIQEYPMYSMASSIRILYEVIEYCIAEGILTTPTNQLNAEGVVMVVKK